MGESMCVQHVCTCGCCGGVCLCVCVDTPLHQSLKEEVGGRGKDRTCEGQMSSANSRNTGVVLAETLTPCGVHPQGHSSFDSRMLTLLGPSGCSGSDKSPPSRSAQLSQGSSAINSPGSVQSTPRQRDPGDVGAPRWRRAGGPDAAEGQSRLPRGGAIPAEPGNKRLSWRDYPGQPGSAVGSAWGSLADGPLLSSRCRRSLVCWNPHLCCLLPPPSAHPPSKALRRRGLF